MDWICSTQNLQAFLRRKYLRPPGPPSRPPPGPPGRGGRRSPLGRSPPEGRSPPAGRSPPEGRSLALAVGLVSSAMMLLQEICLWSLVVDPLCPCWFGLASDQQRTANDGFSML